MLTLDHPAEFLALETPKELVQQISVATESLRRARGKAGGGGKDFNTGLEDLRELLSGRTSDA